MKYRFRKNQKFCNLSLKDNESGKLYFDWSYINKATSKLIDGTLKFIILGRRNNICNAPILVYNSELREFFIKFNIKNYKGYNKQSLTTDYISIEYSEFGKGLKYENYKVVVWVSGNTIYFTLNEKTYTIYS